MTDNVESIRKTISMLDSLNDDKYDNQKIEAAEQQILGFNHASQGYSFIDLIDSMGLTSEEFEALVSDYPETLNPDQILEINNILQDYSGTDMNTENQAPFVIGKTKAMVNMGRSNIFKLKDVGYIESVFNAKDGRAGGGESPFAVFVRVSDGKIGIIKLDELKAIK